MNGFIRPRGREPEMTPLGQVLGAIAVRGAGLWIATPPGLIRAGGGLLPLILAAAASR